VNGFGAPAGMPPAIVARLAKEIERAVALPELRAKLRAAGLEPAYRGPREVEAMMKAEAASFAQIRRTRPGSPPDDGHGPSPESSLPHAVISSGSTAGPVVDGFGLCSWMLPPPPFSPGGPSSRVDRTNVPNDPVIL
jgi:hypothetical protein